MRRLLLLCAALALSRAGWAAGEPDLTLRVVQTEPPSSFVPQMWLQVKNETYAPLDLAALMSSSQLIIDGKTYRRTATTFDGPSGVAAADDWQGCVPFSDYAPIPAGKHKVTFQAGGAKSKEASVTWAPPIDWRRGTLKRRAKEIQTVAAALPKGLPRTCVETWLTTPDGGPQAEHSVRYYLEPGFKILVPYTHAGESGQADEVVSGRVKAYAEPHWEGTR